MAAANNTDNRPLLHVAVIECPECERVFMCNVANSLMVEWCPFCGHRQPPAKLLSETVNAKERIQ